MRVPEPAEGFVVRVDAVADRLSVLAEDEPPAGLTEADPSTGEQWESSQAWAHMVEFVPYWIGQIRHVLDADAAEPAPFGRIKSDPGRIAAIETGRHDSMLSLWERLLEELGELKPFLADLSDEEWQRRGVHQTRGEMDVEHMVEEFLVGHLEEHADQLESLTSPPPAATG